MRIPDSLTNGLSLIPEGTATALIIRHSIRGEIPEGETGNDVPLTTEGRQLAELFGATVSSRLASIMSSPVGRCTETAEHIVKGSGIAFAVPTSRLLGDPGVFIADGQAAWINFRTLGTRGVMLHLAGRDTALPGMHPPQVAAHILLNHVLDRCDTPGIHIFVTHDVVLAGIAGQLIGGIRSADDLPGFLDGAFFWRDGTQVFGCYKSRKVTVGLID
jgi:hypothetical protein